MQPDKRTEQIVFRNSSNQIIFKRGIPANVKSLYLQALQFCGERGIRTPGPVTVNGFQDRRIRPLCHLSGAKIQADTLQPKIIFRMLELRGLRLLSTFYFFLLNLFFIFYRIYPHNVLKIQTLYPSHPFISRIHPFLTQSINSCKADYFHPSPSKTPF